MHPLFAGAPGDDRFYAVIGWLCFVSLVCGPPLFVGGIIALVHWAVSRHEKARKPQK